jgi:hypothetical protein
MYNTVADTSRYGYACERGIDFPRGYVVSLLMWTDELMDQGHYITEAVAETGCLVAVDIMVCHIYLLWELDKRRC